MGAAEARIVSSMLHSDYSVAVDLGCGPGKLAPFIRDRVGHLIGVDQNLSQLKRALRAGLYDKLVQADIRDYEPPAETQAIFMLEVIEHIPKEEGYALLDRLRTVPTVILSTPERFIRAGGHICAWTRHELEELGFLSLYARMPWTQELFYGRSIIAIRSVDANYRLADYAGQTARLIPV